MAPPTYYTYNKESNVKDKVLTKIGLPIDTKISTVEDIAKFQQAFSKAIPYDNSDLVVNKVNKYDPEYIIKRIIDDSIGGTCIHHTILQGLFLTECGFDVQLTRAIKSEVSLSELVQYHYTNLVNVEGKRYFVDSSMGVFNSYVPIELGVTEPVEFLTTSYRCVKTADENTYSFEQKRYHETEYITTFKFIDQPVDINEIEKSQWEYKDHPHTHLLIFIQNKDGSHHMIMKNCMTTITNFAAPSYRPIADNNEFREILATHFNNYDYKLNDIDFHTHDLHRCQA